MSAPIAHSQMMNGANAVSATASSAAPPMVIDRNPEHTMTSPPLLSTPGYWRALTSAAIARYVLRAGTELAFEVNPSEYLRKQVMRWPTNHATKEGGPLDLLQKTLKKHIASDGALRGPAEEVMWKWAKDHITQERSPEKGVARAGLREHVESILQSGKGEDIFRQAMKDVRPYGTKEHVVEEAFSYAFQELRNNNELYQRFTTDCSEQLEALQKKYGQEYNPKGKSTRRAVKFGEWLYSNEDFKKEAVELYQNYAEAHPEAALNKHIELTGRTRKTVIGDVRHRLHRQSYDSLLGVGSTAITVAYSGKVYRDMNKLYAEAAAFEMDKDPNDVGFFDLRRSDNKIIQDTKGNFLTKLGLRLGSDAVFFGRGIAAHPKLRQWRNVNFGEFALGAKGAMLFNDLWGRQTSLYEELISFSDRKLNPARGLGERVSPGDIIDLFQKYSLQYNPDAAFTQVMGRNDREAIRWAQSQCIFERISELMNDTYNYKHATIIDSETGHTEHQIANFALPQFIYLLGHDLMHPDQPKETLAYVEIANTHGMKALRDAEQRIKHGASVESVLADYPVDLEQCRTPRVAEVLDQEVQHLPPVIIEEHTAKKPTAKVEADAAEHATLKKQTAHQQLS